jgi:hypothetical protein
VKKPFAAGHHHGCRAVVAPRVGKKSETDPTQGFWAFVQASFPSISVRNPAFPTSNLRQVSLRRASQQLQQQSAEDGTDCDDDDDDDLDRTVGHYHGGAPWEVSFSVFGPVFGGESPTVPVQ